MTQLTEEHFQLHDANKDRRYQEQKIALRQQYEAQNRIN